MMHTPTQELSTTFHSIISLIGLWGMYTFCFRYYFVEVFRQRIFALRNELFDSAANGLIEFDHPAYCLLRSTMNGFLRFTHRFTLTQILCFRILPRKERASTFEKKWQQAIRDLSPDQKKAISSYRIRLNRIVARHTIVLSTELIGAAVLIGVICMLYWFVAIAALLSAYIAARIWTNWYKRFMQKMVDEVDLTACAYGTSPTLYAPLQPPANGLSPLAPV